MARILKTVSAFAAESPFTEAQVRWWIFNRHRNGISTRGVVVRLGRRVYIDVSAFEEWVNSQQESSRTTV